MADWDKILADLKDAVVLPVKDGAKKFLSENKDAAAFLEDRGKRLAELGVDLLKASTDEERDRAKLQMSVVRQSMRNELSQIAVGASIESRNRFGEILDAAMGVLIKALPAVIAAAI